ncbi:MAG TPA: ABC transporter substrate-binding protein [Candidatus Udaeobacter sp.]|jgi:ABC-type nitrate/sulfonate/bicarbonate transport system substrate-binding protein|nr:ABC transporter substrate-binding protein [Candidatus Udaeobacter sp.]
MIPISIKRLLCCVSILLLASAGRATAEEKIKVAVSNFSPSYMPMFIANKRGYYTEEGLSVDIVLSWACWAAKPS